MLENTGMALSTVASALEASFAGLWAWPSASARSGHAFCSRKPCGSTTLQFALSHRIRVLQGPCECRIEAGRRRWISSILT